MSTEPGLHHWLEDFAACVRQRDTDAGRALFGDETVSFGTRADRTENLDQLVDQQWAPVWASTQGFCFDHPHVALHGPDGAVVATRWSSIAAVDGRERHGRATLAFAADASSPHGWICVHSHFSIVPVAEVFSIVPVAEVL